MCKLAIDGHRYYKQKSTFNKDAKNKWAVKWISKYVKVVDRAYSAATALLPREYRTDFLCYEFESNGEIR